MLGMPPLYKRGTDCINFGFDNDQPKGKVVRGAGCELRGASISITKFTEMGWNDCVFERTEEHLDVLGSAQVFQFMYVEKNLFYYKEILHYAVLRSEWQSFGL